MKAMRRIVSTSLVLLLVLLSLSTGMVAAATKDPDAPPAFSSVKVNGEEIDLSKFPDEYTLYAPGQSSYKLEWSFGEGWYLDAAIVTKYGDWSQIEIKNGDTVKLSKNQSFGLGLYAKDDDGHNDAFFLEVYNGKLSLPDRTIWLENSRSFYVEVENYGNKIKSVTSSDKSVVAIKRKCEDEDNEDAEVWWIATPKKAGTCTITAVVEVNGEKKTLEAKYSVKKMPKALSMLKIGGKKVDLKKNKTTTKEVVKKGNVKIEYKAAKGWKVKSCTYLNAKGKRVKLKNGGTVKAPKKYSEVWITLTLTKGNDTFYYEFALVR